MSKGFQDRVDAGKKLARRLGPYAGRPDTVVVSVPRGGVGVGLEVARFLRLPHYIVVSRKIPEKRRPEWAIGAVTETGDVIWEGGRKSRESGAYLKSAVREQTAEARRRYEAFGAGARKIGGMTVLLVDDGIARGWTLAAAAKTLRGEGAKRIIVAVPVASKTGLRIIRAWADRAVALLVPRRFATVSRYYREFPQVSDARVKELLRRRT